jgi:thymidylate synthase
MKELFIEDDTLPGAYHKALTALEDWGEIVDCPDWKTSQKEAALTIHIRNPLEEPRISKCLIGDARSLQQYEMEMLDGILDFKVRKEGDETDPRWSYTYHQRYSTWYPFVIGELERNPYSRRAAISVRDNGRDFKNDDPACLQHIQFMMRKGRLDMFVLFRSNDLPEAAFYNMWALIRLQEKAARELNLETGTYTHRSNSMHAYQKDFGLLASYVKRIKNGDDLTYPYRDYYRELMEETIPGIREMVEGLKRDTR